MLKKNRLLAASLCFMTCAAVASEGLSNTLEECGVGTLKAYRLFTVGSAKLYRSDCDPSVASDKNNRWLIVFNYETSVPKRAFVESAEEILGRNGIIITPEIKTFNSYYQDIEDGDSYQLNLTDNRLILSLNGKAIGELGGEDAWRYLAIWFGDSPFDKRLKKDLLGLG